MKPLKRPIPFLILVSVMSLLATITTASGAPLENDIYLPIVSNELEPIIPETTVVITEEAVNDMVAISDDLTTLTFDEMTPELAALDSGDIIVSDVTEQAPAGFLRKVVSVTDANGQVQIQTEFATLEEAIEQGSAQVSKTFTPADVESATLAEGVTLDTGRARSGMAEQISLKIDVVLYDADGDYNTKNDQVKANGSVGITPDIEMDVSIKRFSLRELRFVLSVDETVEIELKAEADILSIESEFLIATLNLGTITVLVGPVPVVYVVQMPVYLKANGQVSVGLSTSVTQTASVSAGLGYKEGDWYDISDLNNDFSYQPPELTAEAEIKVLVEPPLFFYLYGVAGSAISINPYVKLKVDLLDDYHWELSAGMEAKAKVEARAFGKNLGDHERVVISSEILLAEGDFKRDTPTSIPTYTPFPSSTPTLLSGGISDPTSMPTSTSEPTWTSTPSSGGISTTPTPSTVTAPTPGESYVNPIDGAIYLHIPAGEFSMGSDDSDNDASYEEKPQHTVYLDEYWIMEAEVTNAQYRQFMEAGGYSTEAYWSAEGWNWLSGRNISQPGLWEDERYDGTQHPVVSITWYEAEAYANWLSTATGLNFGLPTEAQWEKAARGTDSRIYPWGDEWDASKTNASGNADGYEYTAPVGSFPTGASPYGALDMAGNVLEWTADWYDANYYASSPQRNPTGPESGRHRLLRGGAWNGSPYSVRAAYRLWYDPVLWYNDMGFRLWLSSSPDSALRSGHSSRFGTEQ